MKISCSIAAMLAMTTPAFAALRASVSTTTAKTQIVIQGTIFHSVALPCAALPLCSLLC
jgi:hypothetical protein